MLHLSKGILLGPGLGDFFWQLPWCQDQPHRLYGRLIHQSVPGIARLAETLLPGRSIAWIPRSDFIWRFRATFAGYDWDRPLGAYFCEKMGIPFRPTFAPEAIARIPPLRKRKPFVVLHPHSNGIERHWTGWGDLGLADLRCQGVGYFGNDLLPGIEYTLGDFWETARLLRGAEGLICVDSAVLNLGISLGIPTLGIYTGNIQGRLQSAMRPPASGIALDFPEPAQVREAMRTLFPRAFHSSSSRET